MQSRNELKEIVVGIFLLIGLHLAALLLLFILIILIATLNNFIPIPIGTYIISGYRFFILLGSPGLTQLIYLIPIILQLKRQQKWGLMKGVIIGAVLTALLNGGCWIYTIANFMKN